MPFQLLPLLDTMIALYKKPAGIERFQEYIGIIKGGSRADMEVPVGGYNPMGKSHVLERLLELKRIDAENIISKTLDKINIHPGIKDIFRVSVTLADDLMGGWTEHYSTDYGSKFKLNPMIKRRFCSVYFYTSEAFSGEKIVSRTRDYVYRTLYWLDNGKPLNLEDHIKQETAIARQNNTEKQLDSQSFIRCHNIYQHYKESSDYPVIFSFLYGDKAAGLLGYTPLGLSEDNAGLKYAQMLA